MQDEVAAGDRLRPARVAFEVGGGEGEPVAGFGARALQQRAHLGLAREIADGRADLMARRPAVAECSGRR